MIKISINGNRSDIAGYISYYSSKEIAPLLDIEESEIVYETVVADYFAFGDIDMNTKVEALITISNDFVSYIDDLSEIIAKYLSGFTPEFTIRYEIVDPTLIFAYKVQGAKECHCGCHHDEECGCEGECHCHEHEGECECDGECHCHEHECDCGCHHNEE